MGRVHRLRDFFFSEPTQMPNFGRMMRCSSRISRSAAKAMPKMINEVPKAVHQGRVNQHHHGQGEHQHPADQLEDAPVLLLQPAGLEGDTPQR